MEKIKVINLFRLAKRLENKNLPVDLYKKFEKNLNEISESLTSQQKLEIDEIHIKIKKKYIDSVSTETQKLLGVMLI